MPLSHVERGRLGEAMAAAFLEMLGFTIVERNWRFGHLEIDLVARKGSLLAVVEVKLRLGGRHGGAAAAISARKRRDLTTAAVAFAKMRGWRGLTVRFDAVTVDALPGAESRVVLRHIPGAFRAEGPYRL